MGHFRANEPARLWASPLRRRIFQELASGPRTAATVAKAIGARFGQVRYHAAILERARVVRSVRTGRHTYFYRPGAASEQAVLARVALGRVHAARLAEALRNGPASGRELGERLGLPHPTVLRALRRLEAAGVVARCSRGWCARGAGASTARPSGPGQAHAGEDPAPPRNFAD